MIAGILTFLFCLFMYRMYFKILVPERNYNKQKVVGQFTSEVFWGTVITLLISIFYSPTIILAGVGWLFAVLVNIRKIEQL